MINQLKERLSSLPSVFVFVPNKYLIFSCSLFSLLSFFFVDDELKSLRLLLELDDDCRVVISLVWYAFYHI